MIFVNHVKITWNQLKSLNYVQDNIFWQFWTIFFTIYDMYKFEEK